MCISVLIYYISYTPSITCYISYFTSISIELEISLQYMSAENVIVMTLKWKQCHCLRLCYKNDIAELLVSYWNQYTSQESLLGLFLVL